MKRTSSLVVLIVGAVMLYASTGEPYSAGISGRSRVGCGGSGCHGTAPNPNASVVISAPATIAAGGSTNVTVTVTDPTVPVGQFPHYGGFNLSSSGGQFSGANDIRMWSPTEVGHSSNGNNQRSWTVLWTTGAPSLCHFDLFAASNAVNGDLVQSSADHWNLASGSIALQTAGDTTPPATPVFNVPESGAAYFSGSKLAQGLPLTLIIGGPQVIAITATDNTGIDHVAVSVTDATGASTPLGNATYDPSNRRFSISWGAFVPGPYTLTAEAFDCSLNHVAATMQVFVL